MIVIPPVELTDSMITSNVAEPDTGEVAWNPAINYSIGDVVIRTTTHRKYECVVAGTDSTLPENAPTRWNDIGPTNRWAMFDLYRNSATVKSSPITVSIACGKRTPTLFLGGLEATVIDVNITVNGSPVYSRNINQTKRITTGWWDYLFGEFRVLPSRLINDLPQYANAVINITLTNGSGPVKCGSVVVGKAVFLGDAEDNAKSDVLNFSETNRDVFGNAELKPRPTKPRSEQNLWIEKGLVDIVREQRTNLNAKPAVWSTMDDKTNHAYFEAMLILGFYRQFSIDLSYPDRAKITLEVEEI